MHWGQISVLVVNSLASMAGAGAAMRARSTWNRARGTKQVGGGRMLDFRRLVFGLGRPVAGPGVSRAA